MTRQQLSNISLYNGDKLLFLDEFMKIFSQKRWVFDIKPETALKTINNLKLLFKNNNHLLDNIIFLFWGKDEQRMFLNDFPHAVCFARSDECYRAGFATLLAFGCGAKIEKNKIYSLHPKFFGLPLLNKKIVQCFHDKGAKVLGYLPESDKEVQLCLSAGVDYILSNHPPPLSS
jgi:glycerophosphoryl diester phosphodiesterase